MPFGVYVHVPFCQARCGYCDFNTYTATELGPSVSRDSYADTVLLELRLARDVLLGRPRRCRRIFFGGGTPTLLPAAQLGLIVAEIGELFGLAADVEITTEANPESVTPAYLAKLLRGRLHPALGRHAVGGAARCSRCSTASIDPAVPKRSSPRPARPASST